ncbi:glycerol-3-phosphate dehydrogenase C-terminal domain-containing protein [Mucilaginibacter humi]|uniref:glycerol-3-phosphate dehydrogenase C-terminal domain-containing protein n=1 Tax=Mucilaginibacter humi TaxID=2732510 RepID=UPI001FEC2D5E|nr:glycerol-3-phosphate dehydrogenase C-terminal domain-containing protein [Mucilaginibacter humi]
MAEDTVDKAIQVAGLNAGPCHTKQLKIHGYLKKIDDSQLSVYGNDADCIRVLIKAEPELGKRLDDEQPYLGAEVVWAVRNEMARTVEDILARRLRILFLDARAAMSLAPAVARIMAAELNYNLWLGKRRR